MVWFRKHFEKLGLCKYGSAFSKSYQNHNKKVIYGIIKRWTIKKIKEKVRRKDPRTNYRSIHARASSSLPSPSSIPITISSRGGRSSFRSLNCNSRCYTGSRESSSRLIRRSNHWSSSRSSFWYWQCYWRCYWSTTTTINSSCWTSSSGSRAGCTSSQGIASWFTITGKGRGSSIWSTTISRLVRSAAPDKRHYRHYSALALHPAPHLLASVFLHSLMLMVEILSFVIKIVIGILAIERKSLRDRYPPYGTKCYRTSVLSDISLASGSSGSRGYRINGLQDYRIQG